jgi:hypothetical protein
MTEQGLRRRIKLGRWFGGLFGYQMQWFGDRRPNTFTLVSKQALMRKRVNFSVFVEPLLGYKAEPPRCRNEGRHAQQGVWRAVFFARR